MPKQLDAVAGLQARTAALLGVAADVGRRSGGSPGAGARIELCSRVGSYAEASWCG